MGNTAENKPRMTAEEYLHDTEETNCPQELLDGQITAFASPGIRHQRIVGGLITELIQFVKQNGGSCKPFAAPLDVKLDAYNVVQPDVFVVCDPDKLTERYLDGAPDFVCEVVSSNRSDDFSRKLWLYQQSGVREYWIIDPQHEKTLVYFFEQGNFPDIYTFDTPIPVRIWDGALHITVADLELL